MEAESTDDLVAEMDRLVERDQELIGCPYPLFERVQHLDEPAVWSESMGAFWVTRRDLCREIMRDHDTWSSRSPSSVGDRANQMADAMIELAKDPELATAFQALRDDRRQAAVLLNADPPEHVRQRRAVDMAFRPARITAMEPLVQKISDRLVSTFADRGAVEFVHEYAVLLPMEIIARALGVGDDDILKFKKWSDDMAIPVGNASPTVDQVRSFIVSSKEFGDYFGELLDRRAGAPHDDVISDVANAEVDGVRLSRAEQLSMCGQFLVAGNETTTKLITNIAYHLASNPELFARVRDDRSLVDQLVEEVLRYNTPVQGLFRMAKKDTDFHGVDIAAGRSVWLVYAAANRDEDEYPCPHDIRLDRENVRGHLAFGYGEHFCIGAGLARLEARIATNAILDDMPGLALAGGHRPTYEDSFILRGMRTLDLTFEPATS